MNIFDFDELLMEAPVVATPSVGSAWYAYSENLQERIAKLLSRKKTLQAEKLLLILELIDEEAAAFWRGVDNHVLGNDAPKPHPLAITRDGVHGATEQPGSAPSKPINVFDIL